MSEEQIEKAARALAAAYIKGFHGGSFNQPIEAEAQFVENNWNAFNEQACDLLESILPACDIDPE